MAGYNWNHGKSNNAVRAEVNGLMVASKFAAWARRWIKGCTAADVAAALDASEWHHTSKFYNRVDYYDPRDLRWEDCRQALRRQVKARKLLAKLIKQHGDGDRIMVKMSNGADWHTAGKQDIRHLGRVLATVHEGGCRDDAQERRLLAQAGVDHA